MYFWKLLCFVLTGASAKTSLWCHLMCLFLLIASLTLLAKDWVLTYTFERFKPNCLQGQLLSLSLLAIRLPWSALYSYYTMFFLRLTLPGVSRWKLWIWQWHPRAAEQWSKAISGSSRAEALRVLVKDCESQLNCTAMVPLTRPKVWNRTQCNLEIM